MTAGKRQRATGSSARWPLTRSVVPREAATSPARGEAVERLFYRCEAVLGRFLAQIVDNQALAEIYSGHFYEGLRCGDQLDEIENPEASLFGVARIAHLRRCVDAGGCGVHSSALHNGLNQASAMTSNCLPSATCFSGISILKTVRF